MPTRSMRSAIRTAARRSWPRCSKRIMGLHDKHAVTGGLLLHIKTKGNDSAEILDANGKAKPLL